ncbi:hypothetical protein JCM10212_004049 [Sporobolomyces blumeae]
MLPPSTLLSLAVAGTVALGSTPSTASPVGILGRSPSVLTSAGSVDPALVKREFEQSVGRSFAQLASVDSDKSDHDCPTRRTVSRKVKRASTNIPLVNFHDLAYIAQIEVGTPAKPISVLLDTGSADILIPEVGDECTTAAPCYDPRRSRTAVQTGDSTTFTFGQGAYEGKIVEDKVRIGPFTKIKQAFGLISSKASSAGFGGPTFGMLGLSYSSISKIASPNFFDRLRSEKDLTENLFGLFVSRDRASGSELTLGAVDPNRFHGVVTAVPVKSQTHWTLAMTHFLADTDLIYNSTAVYSAIDSGASNTIIPKAATDAYYAKVEGSFADPAINVTTTINGAEVVGQIYGFPCAATLPRPGFVFDGGRRNNFRFDERDLILGPDDKDPSICYGSIIGADVTYGGQQAALIGLNFLRSWYSIYNFDDATVSFARVTE